MKSGVSLQYVARARACREGEGTEEGEARRALSGGSSAGATKGSHWWPRMGGERLHYSRPNPSLSMVSLRCDGRFAAESVIVVTELPD